MNLERFKETLAYIEAHPDEWEQSTSFGLRRSWLEKPGKAVCFGGLVRRLFGGENANASIAGDEACMTWLDCTSAQSRWIYDADRTLYDFREVARTGVIPRASFL